MATYECITFAVSDGVAQITLNRPGTGNAMCLGMVRELAAAALACDRDPSVKVILLSARGRMFSIGGDLKLFSGFGEMAALRLQELTGALHRAIALFARMSAPLVIAVNGTAAGAGFSLSLIGDYVLAASCAKFTMAYTAAGLTPDGGATYYLPRLVGLRRAQELLFSNRTLSAQEAASWGLVTRVVEKADLPGEALAICHRLAAGPRGAHGVVKKLLFCSLGNGLEEQMEMEGREIGRSALSADGREGVRAFVERRVPHFL